VASLEIPIETDLPPEEVRRRLTDFSADRPKIWPGITPELYNVYEVGDTFAEVQEGTKMPLGSFWARERYDWSDPNTITWTVVESSFCKPGDRLSATLRPRDGGGTHIDMHWERTPANLRARLIIPLMVLTKGKMVADSFKKGLS
jgi:hypothetical protein